MAQLSFQQRVQYQEGRKVRGSREARAMGKATRYGRRQQEEQWKNTEADALYKLRDAGVRVPEPHGFFHGVLVMELVTDADGFAAPRLGEYEPTPAQARDFHAVLVRQAVRMLCCGLIHGDLSPYNVLVDAERSDEHTSELQSLMRISYAVFCLKKKTKNNNTKHSNSIRK